MQETVLTSAGLIAILIAVVSYLLKNKDKSIKDDIISLREDEKDICKEIEVTKEKCEKNGERMNKIERNYIDRFNDVNRRIDTLQASVNNLPKQITMEMKLLLKEKYTEKTECALHEGKMREVTESIVNEKINKLYNT